MRRRVMQSYPTKLKNQLSLKDTSLQGTKHIFDVVSIIALGTARTASGQIHSGDKVYRLNFSVNAKMASQNDSTDFDFYIALFRAGQTVGATFPTADWSDIGLSTVRNQIFFSEQNQIGTDDAGPLKRRFSVKVPKIYQRLRDGDSIKLIYDNVGGNIQVNLGCRYSSFT